MKPSDRPVGNPVVVLREESDDWAILFNPDTGEALGVNPIGVQIWRLIDGKTDLGAICDKIVERYSHVPESAPDEVRAFVDKLESLGFAGREA